VEIQLSRVIKRLLNKNIKVNIDKTAKKWIANNGYEPEFGARPIKRLIQKEILDPLAEKIIHNSINQNSIIEIKEFNGKINFSVKNK
jgi:ATP-dependent Clp protease ATP-binding subunit ClpB